MVIVKESKTKWIYVVKTVSYYYKEMHLELLNIYLLIILSTAGRMPNCRSLNLARKQYDRTIKI